MGKEQHAWDRRKMHTSLQLEYTYGVKETTWLTYAQIGGQYSNES
jgi:hypothetical protein